MALQMSERCQSVEALYAALYQEKGIKRTENDAGQGRASDDKKKSYAGIIAAAVCGA